MRFFVPVTIAIVLADNHRPRIGHTARVDIITKRLVSILLAGTLVAPTSAFEIRPDPSRRCNGCVVWIATGRERVWLRIVHEVDARHGQSSTIC